MGYSRYALDEMDKKAMTFTQLIYLIGRRRIYQLKAGHKILGTDEKKFDLVLNGMYDKLEVDEMIRMTAKIISHYFFRNQKKKLRYERTKRKQTEI